MRRRIAIPMLIAVLTVGWAASSQAERTIEDGLEVAFDADFSPRDLPRTQPAPVKVRITGRIATTDGSHPPSLRWLELEIHRNGKLSGEGLPICRAGTLQSTSTQAATARCGSSLVGRGSFRADVDLGRNVIASGKILAFRSRRDGREALLLHLFASVPVRFTLVVPLAISNRKSGQFGTVMRARIPRIGGIVSVTEIGLTIGRRYTHAGKRRSYVSAACSAPPGFSGAPFSFASGRFRFEGHEPIRMTLVRSCSVR
jgi:hypothetical protein